jgi:DNA-binding NarL/FixJ family response regulator
VFELIAEGRSSHGIAERLGLSGPMVEEYVASIFRKLQLPDAPGERVPAVLAYLRR